MARVGVGYLEVAGKVRWLTPRRLASAVRTAWSTSAGMDRFVDDSVVGGDVGEHPVKVDLLLVDRAEQRRRPACR